MAREGFFETKTSNGYLTYFYKKTGSHGYEYHTARFINVPTGDDFRKKLDNFLRSVGEDLLKGIITSKSEMTMPYTSNTLSIIIQTTNVTVDGKLIDPLHSIERYIDLVYDMAGDEIKTEYIDDIPVLDSYYLRISDSSGDCVVNKVVAYAPLSGAIVSHDVSDETPAVGLNLGHRVAHCENYPQGYYLKLKNLDERMRDRLIRSGTKYFTDLLQDK